MEDSTNAHAQRGSNGADTPTEEKFIIIALQITPTGQVQVMVTRSQDFDMAFEHYTHLSGRMAENLELQAYSVDFCEESSGDKESLYCCKRNEGLFARNGNYSAALDESIRLLYPTQIPAICPN